MNIDRNQVFNLMDTNGRRSDVINALNIYLSFLNEENKKDNFNWSAYPNSLCQFYFYKNAIEASPDVFSEHPSFDKIYNEISAELEMYDNGLKEPLITKLSNTDLRSELDKNVEARARHYSSNLCKLGFVTSDRRITSSGKNFLNIDFKKDELESLLPLTYTNIVMFRQLLKLKIFSKKDSLNKRSFYSPFCTALYLLLQEKHTIDDRKFTTIVQSLNPYYPNKNLESIIEEYDANNGNIAKIDIKIPTNFQSNELLSFDVFSKDIKNFKSSKVEKVYYDFYKALFLFNYNQNQDNLDNLINVICSSEGKDKLKKAFNFGLPIFNLDSNNISYDVNTFIVMNEGNDFLTDVDFNKNFYTYYSKSKYYDMVREYSDTTKRMLSATGLFRFDKSLPTLSYKDILKSIFSLEYLKSNAFGEMTENEYKLYEGNENTDCIFNTSSSISEFLGLSKDNVDNKIADIEKIYGVEKDELVGKVKDKTNSDFINHIRTKYPKEKTLEILRLFSDRSNDKVIKQIVNPDASVPTIYEYITAIAWYYISDKPMNLFDSMNLTLNAEFEPILHAAGGDGDIVAQYDDSVVMLEVTLMDKNAQKRGELEPVLRHSTNLKSKNMGKETITFFISDELDSSTVITWRLAILAPREAANSIMVSNIMIMAFTKDELCKFIEKNISSSKIINETQYGFSSGNLNPGWREIIVDRILAQ